MSENSPVVYLAGPMSGLKEYNFAEFNRVATILRENGYVVVNPAETAGGASTLPRAWYFRYDFNIIQHCEYVFVMVNWEKSAGATAEVVLANEMGIPVWALGRKGLPIGEVQVQSVDLNYRIEGGQHNAN